MPKKKENCRQKRFNTSNKVKQSHYSFLFRYRRHIFMKSYNHSLDYHILFLPFAFNVKKIIDFNGKRQGAEMKVNDILTLICFGYRNGQCPLFGTHNPTFYPDKFADRQIRQLLVTCENNENGCTWTDTLGNYEVTTYYRLIFSIEF